MLTFLNVFKSKRFLSVLLILFLITSCAYYNTFFNAEENYRVGLEKKENNPGEQKISKDIVNNFEAAIAKSWAVI